MTSCKALGLVPLGIVLSLGSAHGQTAGDYRDFALRSPVARVVQQTHANPSDISRIHERPALIQELQWRAPYFTTGTNEPQKDSVQQILFSFVDDQLFKMVVDYDRTRTEGMTDADMIAAVSVRYGASVAPLIPTRQPASVMALDSKTAIARWENADVMVVLSRNTFTSAFQLVVMSGQLETRAGIAAADAIRLETAAAPGLERARQQHNADEMRAATEKARAANIASFRP